MLKRIKKYWIKNSSTGQNMIEYTVVFSGIVVALVIALGPAGLLTQRVEDTMNMAMVGTKCVVLQTCFDPEGCPTVCGNDCCEPGESVGSCPADCSLCFSDEDCDDGVACNGVETCDPATGCQSGGAVCSNCGLVLHGDCAEFYVSATVPYDEECDYFERCCDNGVLDGSALHTATSCTVSVPASCGAIPHLGSDRFYQSVTVPCGDSCVWEMRTCDDGVLSGSYPATSCSENCGDCTGPDGAFIANGSSRIYYEFPQQECWTICAQEARECIDGELLGSFTETGCFVTSCDDGIHCTEDICVDNRYDGWGCVNKPHHDWCDDSATCTGSDVVGVDWVCGELCAENDIEDVPAWEIDDDWCDLTLDCQFNERHGECNDGMSCSSDYCAPSYDYSLYPDSVPTIDTIRNCSPPNVGGQSAGECEADLDNDVTGCQYYLDHTVCVDGVDCTWNWCDPQEQDPPLPTSPMQAGATGCWFEPDDALCNDAAHDDDVICTLNWCHLTEDCKYQPDHASCNDGASCTGTLAPVGAWSTDDGTVVVPDVAVGEDWCDVTLDCQFNERHAVCNDGMSCSSDYCAPDYNYSLYPDSVPPITSYHNCAINPMVGECEADDNGTTGCQYYLDHAVCTDDVSCTWNWCDPQQLDPPLPTSPMQAGMTGCWFEPDDGQCVSDGVDCTIDWCSLTADCQYQPDHGFCNDGVGCTGATSVGPVWVSGDGVVTVPGAAIGQDWCDVSSDCETVTVDARCGDGVMCTDDWCHLTSDCQHDANNALCADGVDCTLNTCNVTFDCQTSFRDWMCPAGNACQDPNCTIFGCGLVPISCNDSNVCTNDSCNIVTGCVNSPVSCDDGNICTTDFCSIWWGCLHSAISCNDGNACTTDSCDSTWGCQHTAKDCDDNNLCTIDGCNTVTGACSYTHNCASPPAVCASYCANISPLCGAKQTWIPPIGPIIPGKCVNHSYTINGPACGGVTGTTYQQCAGWCPVPGGWCNATTWTNFCEYNGVEYNFYDYLSDYFQILNSPLCP